MSIVLTALHNYLNKLYNSDVGLYSFVLFTFSFMV